MYKLNLQVLFVIIALFCTISFASEASEALTLAQDYEKSGDIKNAMKFYKKAAMLSVKVDKQTKNSIVAYGNNTIESYKNQETDKTVKQIIFSNFDVKPYRSNYVLLGTYDNANKIGRENFETKFQVSFKKKLSKNLFGLDESIYVAYTQTSWWQTSANSAPFRETNYEPEIFMLAPFIYDKSPFKAYKVGLVHQSNGQDVPKSRSWNRVYASGIFQYSGIFFEPRVWYRFKEKTKTNINDPQGDDNPDIYKYFGYGDLKIVYPYKKHLFSSIVRKKSVQLDWTFPIYGLKDVYGYLQVFSGYGESLIDYDKKVNRIGLGFAITR